MDPLSALSVAGTVVQFVDFGTKLLKAGKDLYKSSTGVSATNAELETIATAIQSVLDKLRQSSETSQVFGPLTNIENEAHLSFDQICNGVASIAEELLRKLQTLKVQNRRHRKWESVRKALKSMLSENEVAGLLKRLAIFKDALNTQILSMLCDKIDSHTIRLSALFDRLEKQPKLIISSFLDAPNKISLMEPLLQLVRRLDNINLYEEQSNDNNGEDLVEAFELFGISPATERLLRSQTNATIIQSLSYEKMTNRYEGIMEPYPETFEWIFHDAVAEQLPWDCFVSWLRTGTGIYWIGGKPGSGKSTLVKHVFEDDRFRQLLKTWAQTTPLCVASCFFWNSGTPEQRSQTGFFKTLLFQIFTRYPYLVPEVLSEVWAASYPPLTSHSVSGPPPSTWSLRQLMTAFKGVLKQTRIPVKIAMLVDGLDEFDGDHEEFVELLTEIGTAQNVKLCVSSRPWIVFKDAFSGCSKLSLQNLTFRDMAHYTRDRFEQSPAFRGLVSFERETLSVLVCEVVEKAQGVFLWVRLVVTSLLRGIRNRDSVDDLRERLRAIPDDLDRLYSLLLDRIEPVYLSWASKTFQVVRKTRELECNGFGRVYESAASIMQACPLMLSSFSLAMDDTFDMGFSWRFNPRSLDELCQKTDIYVTARCGGLLEVLCPTHKTGICPRGSVVYIHRTARDYLEASSHWSRILSWTASEYFDPCITLLKGCVRLQSLWFVSALCSNDEPPFSGAKRRETGVLDGQCAMTTLIYANCSNCCTTTLRLSQIKWLDHLNEIFTRNVGPSWIYKVPFLVTSSIPRAQQSFLDLVTLFQLDNYVRGRWASQPEPTPLHASVLLHRILPNDDELFLSGYPHPSSEMVSVLLSAGADPNWKYDGVSPWENSFRYIFRHCQNTDSSTIKESFKIVKLLLSGGGDPHSLIAVLEESESSPWTFYSLPVLLKRLTKFDQIAGEDLIREYQRMTMPSPIAAGCMNCKAGEGPPATAAETAVSSVELRSSSRKRTREPDDLDDRSASRRSCK